MQPWDLQEGETSKAHKAFVDYLELTDRSLVKLAEKYTKGTPKVRQLKRWSGQYDWVNRAAAWDAHILAEVRQQNERQLIERRAKVQETEWDDAEALRKRAAEIDNLPLTKRVLTDTQTSDDGKTITNYYTIEPVRATARDAARLREAASKLSRLSTGLETDRVKIETEVQTEIETLLADLRGYLSPAAYGEFEAYLLARSGESAEERVTN